MEPFSIQCDSCHANLKVASVSLIGKRLPCPKCKSLIFVDGPTKTPPNRLKETAEDKADPTEVGFDDIDALLAQATAERAIGPQTQQRRKSDKTAQPPSTAPISPAVQSWDNPAATRTRRALGLVAGIFGALLFIAIGSYAWLSRPAGNLPKNSIANSDVAETPIDPPSIVDSVDATDMGAQAKLPSEPELPEAATSDPVVDNTPPPIDIPEVSTPTPSKRPQITSLIEASSTEASPETPGLQTTNLATHRPETSTDEILRPVTPAKSALDELASLLEESGSSISAIADATAAVNSVDTIGVPKYFFQASRAAPISVERQLSQPCAGLRYSDVPLIDILRDITLISGIPVTIDAEHLSKREGNRLIPNVSVDISNVDFREAIKQCAATAGWKPVIAETGILVTQPDAEIAALESVDLTGLSSLSDAARDGMVDAIKAMIASESWLADSEKFNISRRGATLNVKHIPSVQRQVQQFVTKTAAATELAADKTDTQEPLLKKLETRLSKAAANLEISCQLEVSSRTSLHTLLYRIRNKTGVDIIVNWETLAPLGWTSQLTVPGNMSEPTLNQMLQQLERSTKGIAVVIDAKTVELTSPLDAMQRPYVEFYLISDLFQKNFTPQKTLQLVRESIENSTVRASSTTIYEPSCRCIILSAPQSTHRVVETVLQELRRLE